MTQTGNEHQGRRRAPNFIRVMRARPRLSTSIAVGIAAYLVLLLTDWRQPTRILVAWDLCVALYLILAFHMMSCADSHHIRRQSRIQDEGQHTILLLTAISALASLVAILAMLGSGGGSRRTAIELAFASVTIVLSWAFTHTIFALHYAQEFFSNDSGKQAGMLFPGDNPEPDYWDFMYFSFVIGMCAQVSDVTVCSKAIRRTVFAHSVISFVFNAALLALTVNIAASAI
jgi:uncharacterized membrane protein